MQGASRSYRCRGSTSTAIRGRAASVFSDERHRRRYEEQDFQSQGSGQAIHARHLVKAGWGAKADSRRTTKRSSSRLAQLFRSRPTKDVRDRRTDLVRSIFTHGRNHRHV